MNDYIAILWLNCAVFTINLQLVTRSPARNPHGNAKFTISKNFQLYITCLRILCSLLQENLLTSNIYTAPAANIQISVNSIILNSINITIQGGKEASQIWRAAGTAKPGWTSGLNMALAWILMAVLRHYLQWIYIEEMLAIQGHTRQYGIVKGLFHNISIFSLFLTLHQIMGKEHQAHRSTGFTINSIIRQIIICCKSLTNNSGTNSSRNVHTLVGNILPQPLASLQHILIIIQISQTSHTITHISYSYCMTFSCFLLENWLVILIIGRSKAIHPLNQHTLIWISIPLLLEEFRILTSLIKEEFSQSQISLFLGYLIKPQQRQFNFLVTIIALDAIWPKMSINAICQFNSCIQYLLISHSLIICYSGLNKMSSTIQLMTLIQTLKLTLWSLNSKVCIQIPILFLSLGNQIYSFLSQTSQILVIYSLQGIGYCLQPFI